MEMIPKHPENDASPLINIFELPSQTALIIFLMSSLMLLTLTMIAANSRVPLWPVLLLVVILSLRRLLRWPEEEVTRFNLYLAGNRYPVLQQRIQVLSHLLGLPRQPILMLALPTQGLQKNLSSILWTALGGKKGRSSMTGGEGASVFGSLRRWYIWMGASYAADIEEMLKQEGGGARADALLLHELHHFKHGDITQLGWARALRETVFWTIGWALLFGTGYFAILAYAQAGIAANGIDHYIARLTAIYPDLEPLIRGSLPQTSQIEQLRYQQVQFTSLLGHLLANALPVVVVAIALLRYWLRFLRLREIYADSGVAHVQRQITPLIRALVLPARSVKQPRVPWRRNPGTRYHLSTTERFSQLRNPALLFDGPVRYGLEVGFFLFLFEAILFGTTALEVTSAFPIHYPALILFTLLSLRMVVEVVLVGSSSRPRPLWQTLAVMLGLALIPHTFLLLSSLSLLWLGLLFFPDGLVDLLNGSLVLITGYGDPVAKGGFTSESLFSDVVLMSMRNVPQLLFLILFTFLIVWIYSLLVRRMLTWYGYYTAGGSLRRLTYRALLVLGLLISFVLLPPVTDLILGRMQDLLSPPRVMLSLLTLTIIVWSFYQWVSMDRRYRCICPNCSHRVEGAYVLGRRCGNCDTILNPKLAGNFYEMERSVPRVQLAEVGAPKATNRPANEGGQEVLHRRHVLGIRPISLLVVLCAASALLVAAANPHLNIVGFALFLLLFLAIFLVVIRYREYIELPGFWLLLVSLVIASTILLYSPLVATSSLVNLAAEMNLIYSLFTMWVAGTILLWRKDMGPVIFGLVSVIWVWASVVYWRVQGDLLEASLRSLEGIVDPFFVLIMLLLLFATCFLPLSTFSMLGHMIVLLLREWRGIHPTARHLSVIGLPSAGAAYSAAAPATMRPHDEAREVPK